MEAEKPVRTFLAIELPAGVKDDIGSVQKRLKNLLEGVRWTRPEGIHLTLKFFGDIRREDREGIIGVVRERTAGVAPFTMKLGHLGAFPSFKRPRVLWIGLEGETERLAALQGEIEEGLEALGFKKETRSFRPHLTLGRARYSKGTIIGLREAVEDMKIEQKTFSAGTLTLFRSDLRPDGAVYTVLAEFPLPG